MSKFLTLEGPGDEMGKGSERDILDVLGLGKVTVPQPGENGYEGQEHFWQKSASRMAAGGGKATSVFAQYEGLPLAVTDHVFELGRVYTSALALEGKLHRTPTDEEVFALGLIASEEMSLGRRRFRFKGFGRAFKGVGRALKKMPLKKGLGVLKKLAPLAMKAISFTPFGRVAMTALSMTGMGNVISKSLGLPSGTFSGFPGGMLASALGPLGAGNLSSFMGSGSGANFLGKGIAGKLGSVLMKTAGGKLMRMFKGPDGQMTGEEYDKSQVPKEYYDKLPVNQPIPTATEDAAPSLPSYRAGSSSLMPESNASPSPVPEGEQRPRPSLARKMDGDTGQAEGRLFDMAEKRSFASPAQDEAMRAIGSGQTSLLDMIHQQARNPAADTPLQLDAAGDISLHSIIAEGRKRFRKGMRGMKGMGRRKGMRKRRLA